MTPQPQDAKAGELAVIEGEGVRILPGKTIYFHSSIPKVVVNAINAAYRAAVRPLVEALEKLRDCDWTISLPDRMDAVREIARKALEGYHGNDAAVREAERKAYERAANMCSIETASMLEPKQVMALRYMENKFRKLAQEAPNERAG